MNLGDFFYLDVDIKRSDIDNIALQSNRVSHFAFARILYRCESLQKNQLNHIGRSPVIINVILILDLIIIISSSSSNINIVIIVIITSNTTINIIATTITQ